MPMPFLLVFGVILLVLSLCLHQRPAYQLADGTWLDKHEHTVDNGPARGLMMVGLVILAFWAIWCLLLASSNFNPGS